jgi:hypothetical protein
VRWSLLHPRDLFALASKKVPSAVNKADGKTSLQPIVTFELCRNEFERGRLIEMALRRRFKPSHRIRSSAAIAENSTFGGSQSAFHPIDDETAP